MASVKKHLQNLHMEDVSEIRTQGQLGELWEVLKTGAQRNVNPNHRKEVSQKKKELQVVDLKNQCEEEIKRSAQNLLIKDLENPRSSSMTRAYYNQLQSNVFRTPYGNPFFYSHQNYDFLYMLHSQASNQNVARPNNYWVTNLPEATPKLLQSFEPMISRPVHYIPDNNSSFNILPNSVNDDTDILKRANILSTAFTVPLPEADHGHFHSEFCGHSIILHNDHLDYIYNAELHHVTSAGIY